MGTRNHMTRVGCAVPETGALDLQQELGLATSMLSGNPTSLQPSGE
jgi:hypothetical protein